MKRFGKICYTVCMISIGVGLALALLMIWFEFDEAFMWKAMGTAVACFFASAMAFAINRESLREPGGKATEAKD